MRVYVLGDERLLEKVRGRLPAQTCQFMHFSSGEAFLAGALNAAPGCIVAPLLLPDLNCLALLAELKKRQAGFPVIFVGASDEAALAAKALTAGATKCLTRLPPMAAFGKLLQEIMRGLAQVPGEPELARAAAARLSRLTVREREVLERIVAGLPSKTIAHDLSLSPRTVEFYRSRLMKKLNVSGLAQLIRLAIAGGTSLSLMAAASLPLLAYYRNGCIMLAGDTVG